MTKQISKKGKGLFALLLAVVMLLSVMPMNAFAATNDDGYIEVRTIEDLYNIRNDLTANYILMNDIDLTEATAEGGEWDFMGNGWNPIGSNDVYGNTEFSGIFDGNGKKIIGLRAELKNTPTGTGTEKYIGLFTNVSGTVSNLTLENVDITGGTISGAITAMSANGTIENCSVSGNIQNATSKTGGLVGLASNVIFEKCNNKANVTGGADVGGIVGFAEGTTLVKESYNNGTIIADTSIGYYYDYSYNSSNAYWCSYTVYASGISGGKDTAVKVINCYNSGAVIGKAKENQKGYPNLYYSFNTYGIAQNAMVENSYNIGNVVGKNGAIAIGGTATNSYYLNGTGADSVGATSLATAQMKLQSMYKGFDFDNVWFINSDYEYCYPQLISNVQDEHIRVEKINIFYYPENLVFKLNQTPNYDMGMIEVFYVNGDSELLDITPDMVTGVDTSVEGEQTATINYRGTSVTFTVFVTDREMTGIKVLSRPNKTSFVEGTAFDTEGLSVAAVFDDESEEIITGYTISGYTSTPGKKTITVGYNGFSAQFEVNVRTKTLTKIAITTKPSKNTYIEGQELDVSDMVVTASYNNDTTEVIENYSISGFQSVPGTYTVTVEYGGRTASFVVQVKEKTLETISIENLPVKLVYLEGDALDTTGMTVIAHYDNGTSEVIIDYTLSGYSATPGTKTIYVEKDGAIDSFTVTVSAKTLTSISVTNLPRKLIYLEGDSFDETGLEVTAFYNNNTQAVVENYQISGYESTPGVKTVFVTYGGKTTTFDVSVDAKSKTEIFVFSKPNKLTYLEGDNFNSEGLIVKIRYNNNTEEVTSDYTLSGYDSTPGVKLITVTNSTLTCTFTVTVNAKILTGISVDKLPTKTKYIVLKENFDVSGGEITLNYNNNTSENILITDSMISGFSNATVGVKRIVVTYQGKIATFDVEIIKDSVSKAAIPSVESKTDTTVTLTKISGYEYKMDNGAWQSSNIFTGLLPTSTHSFYQRVAETDTTYASESSEVLTITTNKSSVSKPIAPTISSKTYNTVTLTAKSGYEYKMDNGAWQDSNVFSDLSPNTTYTFYQRVKETDTIYESEISTSTTVTTNKMTVQTPSTPTVLSKTYDTVILVAIDGYEYSKDGINWQSSNVFSDLSPNTTYTFYQRVKETNTTYASASSAGTTVTTNKMTVQAPSAPTVESKNYTSVTLVAIDGYEYKMNNGSWQSSNVFSGLTSGKTYTFYQRVKESNTNYVSESSIGLTVKTSVKYGDVSTDGWYYNAVKFVTDNGYFSGYGGTSSFGTSDCIQRQDFVLVLANMDGVDLSAYNGVTNFRDVDPNGYYARAVQWASENGIATGYNTTSFGVGDNITREQLVSILYRYLKNYKNKDVSVSNNSATRYPDYGKVSYWAQEAVIWAIDKGVISGKQTIYIAPVENAQRCEVAQIIYNCISNGIL